ncbi:MAG TPA: YbjN domain-containing protein [Polyangiaceae bacterium]|nr:YbjN domain-containing protein [Polyangiaceae bacterium]
MDSEFDAAKALVEAIIRKFGIDPALARAPSKSDSQVVWTLKRGSASVVVTVTHQENEDVTYLRVVSPVVRLPSDPANQAALIRRVLELNAGGLANAAFGLLGDRIVAVSERPASGLGAEEVEQIIRHLSAVADTFDDRFEKEFGATKA